MIATISFVVQVYLIAWFASTLLTFITGLMITVVDNRLLMSAFTIFLVIAGWLWIIGALAIILAFLICLVMKLLNLV